MSMLGGVVPEIKGVDWVQLVPKEMGVAFCLVSDLELVPM